MPRKPLPGTPAPVLVFGLVFLSGMSSLMFEIVWIRGLGLSLGTSSRSIATVVTAYMIGMALGSMLLGRVADRSPRPLRLYGLIELAIAASGMLISLVLLRGNGALVALGRTFDVVWLPASVQALVRGLMALGLLLVPTTLMGGTIPVLTRALARTAAPGRVVATLYAANTAGAVLGALLPDLVTVPTLGMLATTALVALADLGVGFTAMRMPARSEEPMPATASPLVSAPTRRRALFLFAASGFCALGYELVWSRIIEHLVGGLAIGFAILLAIYLVAVALGSALGARLVSRAQFPIQWAALTLAGSALAMLVPLLTLPSWRDLVVHHLPSAIGVPHPGWIQLGLVRYLALASAVILEGTSALLMGLGLPFLAAAAVGVDSAGQSTGGLYAANTLAGAAGALFTGFVLLPQLGLQRAVAFLSCVAAASAILGLVDRQIGWRLAPTAVTAIAVLILAFWQPRGQLSRSLLHLSEPPLLLEEGSTTTAAVVVKKKFGAELYRYLAQPGVEMSDTTFGSRRYMGLMGHLPLLFSGAGPQEALLICYGVGNTARSLLSHPEVTRLDVVDTSPEVLRLSPVFAQVTGSDPLRDPRTSVTVEDGRFFLAASKRQYDVITAEPPPPTWAGVGNLYSREYYAAARAALRPGGVVAQWLPRFQLTPRALLSIIAALDQEFPYVGLFCGYTEEWILLGSDHPLEIDLPTWSARTSVASVQADLQAIGIRSVEELAATYLQTNDGLRRAAAGAPPVTDDRPVLQYPDEDVKSPWVSPPGLSAEVRELLPFIHLANGQSPNQLLGALEAQHLIVEALSLHDNYAPVQSPQFGGLMADALAREPGRMDVCSLLGLDDDVRAARAALQRDQNQLDPAFLLARRSFSDAKYAATLEWLKRVSPDRARAAQYWSMLSAAEGALGDGAAAAQSLAQFRAVSQAPSQRAGP